MNNNKKILKDLLELEYYTGLNAGRWEQNEYDRLDLMQEWVNFVSNMALKYNIDFNDFDVDYSDEYSLDEFYFELKEIIKSTLLDRIFE